MKFNFDIDIIIIFIFNWEENLAFWFSSPKDFHIGNDIPCSRRQGFSKCDRIAWVVYTVLGQDNSV